MTIDKAYGMRCEIEGMFLAVDIIDGIYKKRAAVPDDVAHEARAAILAAIATMIDDLERKERKEINERYQEERI